jgi:hypothetical protein
VKAIAAEKLDEFGKPTHSSSRRIIQPQHPKSSAKHKRTATDGALNIDTDTEDKTFEGSGTEGGSGSDDDSDGGVLEIANEEV